MLLFFLKVNVNSVIHKIDLVSKRRQNAPINAFFRHEVAFFRLLTPFFAFLRTFAVWDKLSFSAVLFRTLYFLE
jgi:hypothetical protein